MLNVCVLFAFCEMWREFHVCKSRGYSGKVSVVIRWQRSWCQNGILSFDNFQLTGDVFPPILYMAIVLFIIPVTKPNYVVSNEI